MEKQLKQSLGIDVSKLNLSLSLGFLSERLVKEFKSHPDVSNDEPGYRELLKWLKKSVDSTVDLLIVMEATGVYHQGIAHYLHDKGYAVCVMQSGRVKRYAQSLDQRSKTDALDSRMLSMLGLERSIRLWQPPSKELQQLKALSRERSSLLKDRTIETNRQGAISSSVYSNAKALKRHKNRLKLLECQIALIEKEMQELISKNEVLKQKIGFLMSIPGISFISAATVIGETLGFESIVNAKQLASYAGYDIVLRESGNFKGKTRISKRGNSHIRAALHMPSMTCVRCNPTLKQFYNRLKPNKAKPLVALIAVQRKLLILMYTLWKNEEVYDAGFETKKQQKHKALAAQDNNLINQLVS
ncbi:IS110 family transposase [Maribacter sp. TH_r10]|uniref:IS110 family transposase n=1 Tax=Maribacter luteus TaxID=2594478 RepID=A0A6I2MRG2_9FLAO|nr:MULTISPECIES: IS110 family transposase [Maribacter]MDV7141009.1 IS110 family transposase [Maribacter sp. TH_r10]MRX64774.1 IS110 family transposase [Maribacter luteus]